jgi:hypothetical protein
MQVTGPTPITFIAASATIVANSVTFDLNAKTYSISYGDPNNVTSGTLTGALPAAVYTQLQALVGKAIEAHAGWAAGSSSQT